MQLNQYAKEFVQTEHLSYEEWLQYRRRGIGGSYIAAICGISKWRTPIHVYLEKLGESPDQVKNEAVEWGTRLELLISDKFAQEHPEWAIIEKKVIFCHPENEWALANLDRMIICPKRGRGILEIKTASEYLKHEWDNGNIPDYYYVQLQWYLYIMNLDFGYFATLIGGNKYREYEVDRDEDLIAQIARLAQEFWVLFVLARQCPPVDGSVACTKLLSPLYPEAKIATILSLTNINDIELYLDKKQQLKILETTLYAMKNQFKSSLGIHEIGVAGPYKLKWENRTRNGFDSSKLKENYPEIYEDCLKQTHFRQFSIKQEVENDESRLADAV